MGIDNSTSVIAKLEPKAILQLEFILQHKLSDENSEGTPTKCYNILQPNIQLHTVYSSQLKITKEKDVCAQNNDLKCKIQRDFQEWPNWLDVNICFVSGKNEGDFQATAKCLIEQKSRLEGGDEWEPWQECYRRKDEHTHSSIIHSGKLADRVPQAQILNNLLPSDRQLFFGRNQKWFNNTSKNNLQGQCWLQGCSK